MTNTGEPIRFENRAAALNRWFDVYAFRIGPPQSRKVGVLFKDISDRQRIEALREQAEKALLSSEEQSRNILESITDGFFALDRDWRFSYVNRQAEYLLDRTPGDLLGKTIWEVYPGSVGSEFERAYRQAASERVASSFISFYPDHNRWYEAHAYPAADGITVYFRNVTDRKQSEQALRESEANARTRAEELAALMEITPAAIWIADDPQCHQMTANRTAYKLMRTAPGSVTTATPADGSYPLPFKQFKNGQEILPQDLPMQKAIRTNQEVTDELEFVFEDGTVQFIYGKAVPLYDLAGLIRGVIAAFIDITPLKQIEREREQILEREQIAREAAENANRIKDEFLAVLSHELRSPLNPILGWSRLLQTGKLDKAKTAVALATIERNAKLQAELIEDLLDVSRILQGKLSLNVTPVNLAPTIRAAIETVRLAAEAKSIEVDVDIDPNVSNVSGDATRLQQVVWNLLSNAVKFTPNGGRVEIRLTQVDDRAEIVIRDNGKGIAREFLPYVFDYFRQADSATTRKFGGLGLGLAIVRHLVELHGGTVASDSLGEGLGATFTVRLPLRPIEAAKDRAQQLSESSLNLQGVQVLVVDDDTDTRELVVFLLEQAGASVTSATSAEEAFAALTQSRPDILLSDIGMPDMDGYTLIRQVRALPPQQGGQIPAIALTAYAGDFNLKQALAAGFQRHLAKPVEPNELVEAIVTLLGKLSR